MLTSAVIVTGQSVFVSPSEWVHETGSRFIVAPAYDVCYECKGLTACKMSAKHLFFIVNENYDSTLVCRLEFVK
jgi:hypothetical protein